MRVSSVAALVQRRNTPGMAVGCKRRAVSALFPAYRSSNLPRALNVSQTRCSETLFENFFQSARFLFCGALATRGSLSQCSRKRRLPCSIRSTVRELPCAEVRVGCRQIITGVSMAAIGDISAIRIHRSQSSIPEMPTSRARFAPSAFRLWTIAEATEASSGTILSLDADPNAGCSHRHRLTFRDRSALGSSGMA